MKSSSHGPQSKINKSTIAGWMRFSGSRGVHRIDLRAGESELVLGTEYTYTLSPDGQTLYHLEEVVVDAAAHTKIIAHDLGTGENREIAEVDAPPSAVYGLSTSPDGGRLALSAGDGSPRVLIISVSSGTVRELYHNKGAFLDGPQRTIPWTPDGTAILWFRPEVGQAGGLWRIPVNGGIPHLLIPAGRLETAGGLSVGESPTANQLQLSPDSRRLYVHVRTESRRVIG